jgi:hypothetical protein
MAHTSKIIPRKEPYAPKVTKSVILVCKTCTKRYIKTRTSQDACLQCFVKSRDLKKTLKR